RRATEADVPALVALLRDDLLGAVRETGTAHETGAAAVGRAGAASGSAPASPGAEETDPYARAFALIDADPNQLLVAVTEAAGQPDSAVQADTAGQPDSAGQADAAGDADPAVQDHAGSTIVGTLQLSLLPSLSRQGSLRLQIEAVRIGAAAQAVGLGTAVFEWAHECGRRFGAGLAQLTTDKSRTDARRFYDRLGYVASDEGMKRPLD
ncbi:MAG: GNAT family N-acetyltransferase, partial [Brevibacterium sp.]|uniref:GNAT family N-acetyltransferase n=1 Tax=Brevibacterium sp. TaxID=1701 RepID=UPI003F93489B